MVYARSYYRVICCPAKTAVVTLTLILKPRKLSVHHQMCLHTIELKFLVDTIYSFEFYAKNVSQSVTRQAYW